MPELELDARWAMTREDLMDLADTQRRVVEEVQRRKLWRVYETDKGKDKDHTLVKVEAEEEKELPGLPVTPFCKIEMPGTMRANTQSRAGIGFRVSSF